jgi:DNA-binding GntR family transcriptional regulator
VSAVLDALRDRILSGAVAAGRPVRQDALAAELGISKIPLREALARLEQEGLVRAEPNRGFFVRPLSAAEAEEVYELRLKLEPDAAAAGAAAATPADQAEAEAASEALAEAIARGSASVGALNRAYHIALVRPSGQAVTTEILARLHVLSQRYVRVHLEPGGRGDRAGEEHRELLDAWLGRRLYRVRALTRDHIGATLEDLRRQLARGETGAA